MDKGKRYDSMDWNTLVYELKKIEDEETYAKAIIQSRCAPMYIISRAYEWSRNETRAVSPKFHMDICLAAVKKNGGVLVHIEEQTEEMVFVVACAPSSTRLFFLRRNAVPRRSEE